MINMDSVYMVEFYHLGDDMNGRKVIKWVTIEECPECGKNLGYSLSDIFVDSMSDIDRDKVIEHTSGKIVSKYYPLCVECA